MITVAVLICLITLTSQLVNSKVITINITSGNSSQECCTEEGCMCASLSIALQYIDSNTTINITSSSVILGESVKLGSGRTSGSGNLTNIIITGSNVTIMCNNSGSVYCESCDHVMIGGITWDSCGDPYGANIAGVTFNGASNISLVNCTFQYSQMSAVTLVNVSKNVNVNHCNFLSNVLPIYDCDNILYIVSKFSNQIYLNISDSYFYGNYLNCTTLPFYIFNVEGTALWHITVTKTTFVSNNGNMISFNNNGNVFIELRELHIYSNNNYLYGNLLEINSGSYHYAPILVDNDQLDKAEIFIINSSFTNNYGSIVFSPSTFQIQIYLIDVEISLNVPGCDGTLTINFLDSDPTIYNYKALVNMIRVNVMSNKYLSNCLMKPGIVNIKFRHSNQDKSVTFEECEFYNNTSISNQGVFYISNDADQSLWSPTITILNSKIHHNYGYGKVIYLNNMGVTLNSSNFTDNVGSAIYLVNSNLVFAGTVIFANNTADNGGALYIEQGSHISFYTTTVVQQ